MNHKGCMVHGGILGMKDDRTKYIWKKDDRE